MARRAGFVDQFFIPDAELVDVYASATRTPVAWLPWGTDTLAGQAGRFSGARAYDVLRLGRQPAVLDDDTVTSRGWSAELLLPWAELTRLSGGSITAAGGWSVPAFVGRFQHVPIGDAFHTAAWCLRSHGVMDTHQPSRFALLACGAVHS